MRQPVRFATDATVGKLGRYLRAAGFDTVCQHQSRQVDFFDIINLERVILTRSTRLRSRFQTRCLVFIRDNDPLQQMMQVVRELNLRWCDVKPFSRCLVCNDDIRQVARDAVAGRVPLYVWQRHHTFHACSQCGRIYWAGSHHNRMCKRLAAIFNQKDEKPHAC